MTTHKLAGSRRPEPVKHARVLALRSDDSVTGADRAALRPEAGQTQDVLAALAVQIGGAR